MLLFMHGALPPVRLSKAVDSNCVRVKCTAAKVAITLCKSGDYSQWTTLTADEAAKTAPVNAYPTSSSHGAKNWLHA